MPHAGTAHKLPGHPSCCAVLLISSARPSSQMLACRAPPLPLPLPGQPAAPAARLHAAAFNCIAMAHPHVASIDCEHLWMRSSERGARLQLATWHGSLACRMPWAGAAGLQILHCFPGAHIIIISSSRAHHNDSYGSVSSTLCSNRRRGAGQRRAQQRLNALWWHANASQRTTI